MSDIHGAAHDWVRLGSVQWGMLGLSHEVARTNFKCKTCGEEFSHYYHQESNIYKATEDAGVPKECVAEGQKEK